eukprot:gene10597-19335_t
MKLARKETDLSRLWWWLVQDDLVTVFLSSGGHTMEILALLRGLSVKFTPKVYVIADTDKRSQHKVLEFEKSKIAEFDGKSEFNIRRIPRSREVGQSYLTSVISTVVSSFFSFSMVIQEMPDLILCNGPGTCVPVCICGFLLKGSLTTLTTAGVSLIVNPVNCHALDGCTEGAFD